MWCLGGINTGDICRQINTVHNPVGGQVSTRRCRGGGIHIEVMHGRIKCFSGRQARRPAGQERHPNAPFKERDFPASIGFIHIRQANVTGTAIV